MRELASVRTNVLLTPVEHRTWAARAGNAGNPVRDLAMRRQVADELGRDPVLLDPTILDFAPAA